MEFAQLIKKRFSVRKFKEQEIEKEKLMQVLEAGRLAPSAVNFQPWHFVVVKDKDKLAELHTTYHRDWFKEAPMVIVVCADHSQSWKRGNDGKDSADIDAAIAIDHMTLMAAELGLGTCWVCNFEGMACSKLLHLSDDVEPIALLPIGYPDTLPKEKKRKALEEIVHLNEFGKALK